MIPKFIFTAVLLSIFLDIEAQRKLSRPLPSLTETKGRERANFDCPEEFGYYPHPTDCTQYYVCVFGGALLESCTGGLMYSHELQTCDWPRNVGCDGLELAAPVPSSSSPGGSQQVRSKDRLREKDDTKSEQRIKYAPPAPPPPPQPKAVVTSRGQPRQLQTQQEIIKQPLYADVEDALPPAEEIESDRQQRVYRGQPSTIGQVQRDRDGYRHTNSLSSRGEKVEVISFGTQSQQQPYSIATNLDEILTNDLTTEKRLKRHAQLSRVEYHKDITQWQNSQKKRNASPYVNGFRSSPLIGANEEEFQPFIPASYSNLVLTKHSPPIYSHYNIQRPLPSNIVPSYVQFRNNPVNQYRHKNNRYNPTRIETAYSNVVPQKIDLRKAHLRTNSNSKLRNNLPARYQHANKNESKKNTDHLQKDKRTEKESAEIKEQIPSTSQEIRVSDENNKYVDDYKEVKDDEVKNEEGKEESDSGEEGESSDEEKETNKEASPMNSTTTYEYHSHDHDDDDLGPPPSFFSNRNKYEDIHNPFSDPNFDFDNFLRKLGSTTTSTTTTTTTTTPKPKISSDRVIPYPPPDLRNILTEQYIKQNPKLGVTINYKDLLKLLMPATPAPALTKLVNNTSTKSAPIEYEYYYEEYDYPETDPTNKYVSKLTDDSKNKYLDSNAEKSATVKTIEPITLGYSEYPVITPKPKITSVKSILTTQQLKDKPFNQITTTPKSKQIYTTKRNIIMTLSTTKSSNQRQRRITTESYSFDSKQEPSVLTSSDEKSSISPSVSTTTATARAIYNNSQYNHVHNNDNRYDPYYALYDDDVELYKDVDYTPQNHYNSQQQTKSTTNVYRGSTISAVRDDSSKRGSNPYNSVSQDIYQPSTVSDYGESSYQDDENTYRQSSRGQNSLRGDRNEINDIEEIPTTKRITTTTRKLTTTTTRTTTTQARTLSTKKSITASPRTPSRGRGTSHYSNGSGSGSNNEATATVNRGTPATRSRPTLKPSTSIVSKAVEYVDVYRFPPIRPEPIYPQPQPDKTAAKCRKDVCLLPDCYCGGKDIPGDLPVEQVPQIVLLTFDDSVNDLNKGLYQDLFERGRTNPNGCPIAATFYVSHEWTDYSQVQNLYSDGHELASHTVSHSFGEQFSQKKWTREVAGQREILAAYGGIKMEDVRGMRAPFLSVGGNKMFKMLYDSNFTYDSSMPIYENKPPSWPYTLDYKLFHDCMIPPCPTRSYPGVWEVPMVMWQDLNGGRCSMGDACSNPPDADGVYKMLLKNFERHYTTNRAPFGLFYHAAWFTQPHHKEGFINFIDSVLAMKDVWFITNWQAIQWVRDPTPSSRLSSFQPFQCNYSDRPKRCNNPKVCNLWHKSGVRYMRTCQPCPDIYPWTGNTGIRSSRVDNDIED